MLKIKYETTAPISFDISATLTALSIVIGDITEAVFLLKIDPADLDNVAVVNKSLVSGIAVNGADKLDVTLALADYGTGNIEQNEIYFIGLGIKTATLTEFYETPILNIDDAEDPFKDSRILFEPDTIRA
jgi:hypothetical protein